MPAMAILSLPTDILTLITPYLGKDILPFRMVCKRFRDVSPVVFEAYKNKLFVDRYGARAECEKDISFDALIQRIESAAAIKEKLGINRTFQEVLLTSGDYEPKFERHLASFYDLWLEIDLSEAPRLVEYEKASFFKKDPSTLERLKSRYRFYRREFHRERDIRVQNLLRLQDLVARDLTWQPFNSIYPLQDLRDRCRRLQTLQDERASLSHAMKASRGSYNSFLRKLSRIETVFFFVISWVHSWFQKPYTDELKIPALPASFDSLNKKGVILGKTKITFQGQEIPVEIRARFGSYDESTFSKRTVFGIYRQDDQSTLGHFGIQRSWTHIKPDCFPDRDYSEGVVGAGIDVGTLENPRLYIEYFENPELQQDMTNGDRPIMRLLTQIAVEVFQLEKDKRLEITSNHCHADVYVAGGFSKSYSSSNYLKNRLQKARDNNRLFPAYKDLTSFEVYLEKSPSNPLTHFVTKNSENEEQPAMVDFDFDHPPITWEEQIAKNRLLPEKGPILPKFFIDDLSRFEKPPQSA